MAGIVCGIAFRVPVPIAGLALLLALVAAVRVYSRADSPAVFGLVLAGWLAAGAALGSDAERLAQAPPLRRAALAEGAGAHPWPGVGGRDGRQPAAGPSAPPLPHSSSEPAREQAVTLVGQLRQDASVLPQGVGLALQADTLTRDSHVVSVSGGVMLDGSRWSRVRARAAVAGRSAAPGAGGRARTGPPPDPGVPDLPLSLARRGTVLVGSVKSAALVAVLEDGSWREEQMASARHRIRQLTALSVGSWDATSAAIVTAILIGDRAGLDDRVERDLQEAGTYHVIAISGGNIAILAGCLLLACRLLLVPWRAGLALTIILLLAYAELAGGGSSVDRATTMAVVYLGTLLIDHQFCRERTGRGGVPDSRRQPAGARRPGLPADVWGLDRDCRRRTSHDRCRRRSAAPSTGGCAHRCVRGHGSGAAAARPAFFSRVTVAGLLFNCAAVPLMSIVQIVGMAAVAATAVFPSLAHAAGWAPHAAARGLVSSAALVHVAPWLTWRVPSPPLWLIAVYYIGLIAFVSVRAWVRWTIPWHRAVRPAAGPTGLRVRSSS